MSDSSLCLSPLRYRVICPHCWHEFPPEDVLWIAVHPDLCGDPLLGQDAYLRFLPCRFDAKGHALDERGMPCRDLACPDCHLFVSRAALQMRPLYVSVLGAPGAGKAHFLATMAWRLRQVISEMFSIRFSDADPRANERLLEYQERLFLNPQPDVLTYLEKTELEGELYAAVHRDAGTIWYPRPFVFELQPEPNFRTFPCSAPDSYVLYLYDNSGEHFLPGGETARRPEQHFAMSDATLYLFDPTHHPRFRKSCKRHSADPQWKLGWAPRQDQVFLEMAGRVRRFQGWSMAKKYNRPLVVVVTKYDAWRSLIDGSLPAVSHLICKSRTDRSVFEADALCLVSNSLRTLLVQMAPEVVQAVESFAEDVVYVPVSSLGHSPELTQTQALGFRPEQVRPFWVEVPMLYVLSQTAAGLFCPAEATHDTPDRQLMPLPDADIDQQPATGSWQKGSWFRRIVKWIRPSLRIGDTLENLGPSTEEGSLEPLLRQLRFHALARSPLWKQVQILQQITRCAPQNFEWKADLQTWERICQSEARGEDLNKK